MRDTDFEHKVNTPKDPPPKKEPSEVEKTSAANAAAVSDATLDFLVGILSPVVVLTATPSIYVTPIALPRAVVKQR